MRAFRRCLIVDLEYTRAFDLSMPFTLLALILNFCSLTATATVALHGIVASSGEHDAICIIWNTCLFGSSAMRVLSVVRYVTLHSKCCINCVILLPVLVYAKQISPCKYDIVGCSTRDTEGC